MKINKVHIGDIFYGTKTICGRKLSGHNVNDIGNNSLGRKVTCLKCLAIYKKRKYRK